MFPMKLQNFKILKPNLKPKQKIDFKTFVRLSSAGYKLPKII